MLTRTGSHRIPVCSQSSEAEEDAPKKPAPSREEESSEDSSESEEEQPTKTVQSSVKRKQSSEQGERFTSVVGEASLCELRHITSLDACAK